MTNEKLWQAMMKSDGRGALRAVLETNDDVRLVQSEVSRDLHRGSKVKLEIEITERPDWSKTFTVTNPISNEPGWLKSQFDLYTQGMAHRRWSVGFVPYHPRCIPKVGDIMTFGRCPAQFLFGGKPKPRLKLHKANW